MKDEKASDMTTHAPSLNSHRTSLYMLTFRPATIDDTADILALIRELAEYEKLSHEVKATEEGLRESLFGAKPYAEVVLAHVDGALAGFCLFFHNYSTFLGQPGIYIEDLYVRPDFRSGGIGTAFFAELAKLAEARNCGRIEWWVLDWNEPALNFYKKLGAVPMDEWTVWRLKMNDERYEMSDKRKEMEHEG